MAGRTCGIRRDGGVAVAADARAFQMVIGRRLDALRPLPRVAFHPLGRAAYLERWRALDERLFARLRPPAICFGVGEAAALLRAYAPRAWSLVTACTVDGDAGGTFGDLPIVALDRVTTSGTVLLGVRPADQPPVAERLRDRFPRVVMVQSGRCRAALTADPHVPMA